MLDPRAVAMQGVGFSPRLLALQGFALDDQPAPIQYNPGGRAFPALKPRVNKSHRDRDDDLLMFLLR